jgi:hypothetical protein
VISDNTDNYCVGSDAMTDLQKLKFSVDKISDFNTARSFKLNN